MIFTFFSTGNGRKCNSRCKRNYIYKTSHNHKQLELFKINPVFFEIIQLRRLRLTEACFNRKVQFDYFRAGIFFLPPPTTMVSVLLVIIISYGYNAVPERRFRNSHVVIYFFVSITYIWEDSTLSPVWSKPPRSVG